MNRGCDCRRVKAKLNRHRQRSVGTLKIEHEYEYDSGSFLTDEAPAGRSGNC
jgi:hypothetical protein